MRGLAAGAAVAMGAPRPLRRDLAELLHLAGPVVAARVGVMTMGLTDALVVGRYSAVQLGFQALGWALVSVVVVTAMGLLSGVQVMASQALGEGRPRDAGAALRRGLAYGLWIGVGASALLIVGGPAFLHAGWISPHLADGATGPLIVLSLSLPGFTLSVAAGSWLEGLGRPRPVMVFMWIANIVNLAVNLVLVPGLFGLPALGASGAAWATFSSRSLLTAATLIYIAGMADARALGVFAKPARDKVISLRRSIGSSKGRLKSLVAQALLVLDAGPAGDEQRHQPDADNTARAGEKNPHRRQTTPRDDFTLRLTARLYRSARPPIVRRSGSFTGHS